METASISSFHCWASRFRQRAPTQPRGTCCVADVTGPRLEVAGLLGRVSTLDHDRDIEPPREGLAVRSVGARVVAAKPVVDVQSCHDPGPREHHREVEQADRVAPAGQQDHDRAPSRKQAAFTHAREDRPFAGFVARAQILGFAIGH